MKSRIGRFLLAIVVINCMANTALALAFPGPFSFSFANSALNSWFLLPFTLIGCV